MRAHDRWLANYSSLPVEITCTDCGHRWDGTSVSEFGTGWLEPHEDCPKCGSTKLDADDMDENDIRERRLEANGIDF